MNLIKNIVVDYSCQRSPNYVVDLQMEDGEDGYGRLLDTTTNTTEGIIEAIVRGINAEVKQSAAQKETDSKKS